MEKMKIWEIDGSFYNTEKGFKKAIEQYLKYNHLDNVKYRIFELSETFTIADYKRQKESNDRDKVIRSVLGELTKEEKKEIELKAKFENFIKVMDRLGINDSNYEFIKGNTHKPKFLLKFIKDNKEHFLSLSNNIEYYKALLNVHMFRGLSKKEEYWDYKTNTILLKETLHLDKSYHDAFDAAKLELKNKK